MGYIRGYMGAYSMLYRGYMEAYSTLVLYSANGKVNGN